MGFLHTCMYGVRLCVCTTCPLARHIVCSMNLCAVCTHAPCSVRARDTHIHVRPTPVCALCVCNAAGLPCAVRSVCCYVRTVRCDMCSACVLCTVSLCAALPVAFCAHVPRNDAPTPTPGPESVVSLKTMTCDDL